MHVQVHVVFDRVQLAGKKYLNGNSPPERTKPQITNQAVVVTHARQGSGAFQSCDVTGKNIPWDKYILQLVVVVVVGTGTIVGITEASKVDISLNSMLH